MLSLSETGDCGRSGQWRIAVLRGDTEGVQGCPCVTGTCSACPEGMDCEITPGSIGACWYP